MNAVRPQDPSSSDPRDPQQRIEELESHVRALTGLVEALVAREQRRDEADGRIPIVMPAPPKPRLVEGVREGVGRALGGEAGESLESRIGGIWLSRVAAVLTMTAIVLGAAMTIGDQDVLPYHKIIVGYGLALGTIWYGLISSRRQNIFAQTMLGCGLAILYFTTYAGFFIESAQVFGDRRAAIPVLSICLLVLAVVCHFRRSETAAGISLFLIYYTVVLSLSGSGSREDVLYSLLTCLMVSILSLVFHLTHRWMFFTWVALIATHLTYIFFFVAKPPELDLSDEAYFWVSNGFLTLTYVLFSLACITDAHKMGEYRKTVASMAGVNSFVFLVLTWIAIRQQYPEQEWAFRLAIAGLLGVFALYANYAGPRRNYLYQIFIAKMVVMFTLALQAYLSHEWLLVAMAVECLGLAFSYKRSGTVMFKVLGLALMGITFVGCLLTVRIPGTVTILEYGIPANWFSSVGVAGVFAIVAWFYDHFVRKTRRADRVAKVQWFLADTLLDVSSHSMALMHGAASAMILLFITIIDLGDNPVLPFILAGEALILAIAGFLLRTPPVEVASVLLLIAAHVCFHVFLSLDKEGFEEQESYALYTVLVALFTLFGGYLWERYLKRIKGGRAWGNVLLASIPYLTATIMLTTLMHRRLEPLFIPVGDNALGVALLLAASITLLQGLRASGMVALALGTTNFYVGLFNYEAAYTEHPSFLLSLGIVLATLMFAERFVALWKDEQVQAPAIAPVLRTMLVAVGGVLGLLGLWRWSIAEYVTLYWLGLAVAAMALGVMMRESRYRWAALAIYLVTIVRAYVVDLRTLSPMYQFLSFAALCVPLLVISWGYSHYRVRMLRKLKTEDHERVAPNGERVAPDG